MSLVEYFLDYFETNRFTLVLVLFLMVLPFLKRFVRLRPIPVRTQLIIIVGLGLALRLFWLNFSSASVHTSWSQTGRSEYDLINLYAIDMTQGVWFVDAHGDPSLRRPIGYPLFLGLLYNMFGVHIAVAWAAHLLLYLGTVISLYFLAKLIFSERVGLLTAFFYSIYPIAVYSTKMLLDEHLFLPLWYFGLWLVIRHVRGKPVRGALFWYGLLFGYAAMVRTHAVMMPLVVALAVFLVKRSWKKTLVALGVVLILMQLVNLPWVIRNYRIWGVPVLYTASSCWLYSRLNSSATPEGGGAIPGPADADYSEALETAKTGNQAVYDRLCSEAMFRWIVRHPLEFLDLGTKKLLVFMGWDRKGVWPIWHQFYPGNFDPSRPLGAPVRHWLEEIAYIFYYVLFFTFLFACIFLLWRWRLWSRETRHSLVIVGSIFFLWLCEHLIIFADRKYRFPLEPLMIMVACVFIDYLIRDFDWRKVVWRWRPKGLG